eukprot:SAG11_NODE_938_length_6471_cov_4.156780_8_plen_46_part_00
MMLLTLDGNGDGDVTMGEMFWSGKLYVWQYSGRDGRSMPKRSASN